jgi:hypothetical protein
MDTPDKIAYIGIGGYNMEGKKDICYLKLCQFNKGEYIVEDVVGNSFTYKRDHILAYIPLLKKEPENDKQHTVHVIDGTRADMDMKCYYCNAKGKEYLMYYEDGKKYCTTVCSNICLAYFERQKTTLNCLECTGGTSLFKQRWLGFQNDDGTIVRFRYCHGSAECMDNLTKKFQKVIKTELLHRCEECNTAASKKDLKLCGNCRTIFYCSKDCQEKNWKIHKLVCKTLAT